MKASFANSFRAVAAVTLFGLCTALPMAGQTSGNGNINGTVTDPTGAIVPNATVVVTNTDTGIARTLTTNSAGTYNANFLLPGHYEVVPAAYLSGRLIVKTSSSLSVRYLPLMQRSARHSQHRH